MTPPRIALTFDAEHPDRPTTPGITAGLLDALREAGVRATFFLQGRWVEAEPALARRIADEGHLVGNHSHHHARLTLLTAAGIRRDAAAADAVIRAATGAEPRPWYRCPFGAGARSPRVADALAAVGYRDCGWTVDGRDWADPAPQALRRRVVREALAGGDGGVILLHGWPTSTGAALPGILRDLADGGADLVALDALPAVPGLRSTVEPA